MNKTTLLLLILLGGIIIGTYMFMKSNSIPLSAQGNTTSNFLQK